MPRTPEERQTLDEISHRGVANRDEDMMRLALEKGATPDGFVADLFKNSMLAGVDGSLLSLALDKGANANTLLFAAVNAQALGAVKIAVERGRADVNASHHVPGKTEDSPLADMVYRKFKTEIAEYLIGKGMQVDARNEKGETPLLRAITDQDCPLITYYLNHGANPLVADKQGRFPLQVAQQVEARSYTSYADKRDDIIKAMLKNIPEETNDAAPAPAFNEAAIAAPIEVNHPLGLKKKNADDGPARGQKGFSL